MPMLSRQGKQDDLSGKGILIDAMVDIEFFVLGGKRDVSCSYNSRI